MFCGSCGSPVPENTRFCANCGASVDQAGAAAKGNAAAPSPRAQYIPPGQPASSPPPGPKRTVLWAGVGMAALIIIAAAVAIPLVLRSQDDESAATTTVASTASSTAGSDTTATSPTAPPTTAGASGPVGDSAGTWVEVSVPGGPWETIDVAVSDDALLISTYDSAHNVNSLYAVMLGSGDVIPLAEDVENQWGMDIDGRLAVWWQAAGWDDAAMTCAEQHVYSCLLPGGARTEVAGGGATIKRLPQVAQSLVTWVEGAPWPDNPMEYEIERIFGAAIDSNGVPTGASSTLVSSALAFVMGDSSWQYSLSDTRLAWETGFADGGYDVGTHVNSLSTVDHVWVGAEAWRPSLWGDTLAYWQDGEGVRITGLAGEGTRTVDLNGYYPTAGPTFAAYYRSSGAGSDIVARGYGGSYEQVLGAHPDAWWMCPPIAVSSRHIAFTVGSDLHLFEWQAH